MNEPNFGAEAGLYAGKGLRRSKGPRYKRFETVAEALRYAIEDMPGSQLRGSVLEVDETRFDEKQIRALYDSANYPLERGSEPILPPTHTRKKRTQRIQATARKL